MSDLVIGCLTLDGEPYKHVREHEATLCIDIEDESSHAYTYINKSQAADIIDHLKRVFELED